MFTNFCESSNMAKFRGPPEVPTAMQTQVREMLNLGVNNKPIT